MDGNTAIQATVLVTRLSRRVPNTVAAVIPPPLRLLCVLNVKVPDIPSSLPQEHGVIPGFVLYPPAESCDKVSL